MATAALTDAYEQAGGQTVSGDVANGDRESSVVAREEVEVVPSHRGCRPERGVHRGWTVVEVRWWQQALLNLSCELELPRELLLLGHLVEHALDGIGHGVEGLCELAKLVVPADPDAMRQIAGRDLPSTV